MRHLSYESNQQLHYIHGLSLLLPPSSPEQVIKAERFLGPFPDLGAPVVPSTRLDQRFRSTLEAAEMVLSGYVRNVDEVVQELVREKPSHTGWWQQGSRVAGWQG